MRILLLTWRDVGHPEAGGAEMFVERVSAGLVAAGHQVTVFTAGYADAVADEAFPARRTIRRGGRYTVYARGAAHLLRRGGSYDVILDVQNGVPFWSPAWTKTPVVNVVHHIHREQWPEVFGPAQARLGWWLESRLAPRVYSRQAYLTVSEATKAELVQLGVDAARVSVVYSGNDLPPADFTEGVGRTAHPSFVVLGRLVPHKRIELAIDAMAANIATHPDLRLTVVGHGYWEPQLRAYALRSGVAGAVDFTGYVDERTKHRLLAQSWVALLPSIKEGWGLAVVEAGAQGTPTVAFRAAGGTAESVVDGVTGLLANDDAGFVTLAGRLLDQHQFRRSLGSAAAQHARAFSWEATAGQVAAVLAAAAGMPGGAASPEDAVGGGDAVPTDVDDPTPAAGR